MVRVNALGGHMAGGGRRAASVPGLSVSALRLENEAETAMAASALHQTVLMPSAWQPTCETQLHSQLLPTSLNTHLSVLSACFQQPVSASAPRDAVSGLGKVALGLVGDSRRTNHPRPDSPAHHPNRQVASLGLLPMLP